MKVNIIKSNIIHLSHSTLIMFLNPREISKTSYNLGRMEYYYGIV